jgi:glutamine amidotransferase
VVEASQKVPMLGVCLGMQVMLEYSHENDGVAALGLFPGEVVRFPDPPKEPNANGDRLKVPHMGWNRVKQTGKHPIWEGVPDDTWFYFVHSYHARPRKPEHTIGTSDYIQTFTCAIARDNLVAFQFHPEKSQGAGLRLLANFAQWDGTP